MDARFPGLGAALFRSSDGGNRWELNESLNNHPTRSKWTPGAGGLCLHSIVLDPSRPKRMYVGISAVGVFKTEDAGKTWDVKNKNVRADFAPVKYPEFGQCVHKLVMDPKKPSSLYQQNHCGVYRSYDAAENWVEITKGLPSQFGFPMAIHPHDSERFYIVPEEGDFFRAAPRKQFAVYETRNAGRTWVKRSKGLPAKDAYMGCFREGLATDELDPSGVYVGTRMGHLFHSADEGKTWRLLAQWLPPLFGLYSDNNVNRLQGCIGLNRCPIQGRIRPGPRKPCWRLSASTSCLTPCGSFTFSKVIMTFPSLRKETSPNIFRFPRRGPP